MCFNMKNLPLFTGCNCGSPGKESTLNAGDLGWIPGLGRSPREGKGYPLQYSSLDNSMDTLFLQLSCIVYIKDVNRTIQFLIIELS